MDEEKTDPVRIKLIPFSWDRFAKVMGVDPRTLPKKQFREYKRNMILGMKQKTAEEGAERKRFTDALEGAIRGKK